MNTALSIIPTDLQAQYCAMPANDAQADFESLEDSGLSTNAFSFYASVSAVFSSKIEGERIELDSYIKHKLSVAQLLPDYVVRTEDLYSAYIYAQQSSLNQAGIEKAHAILSKDMLLPDQRGTIRNGNMFVITTDGRIEYVAAAPNIAKQDMKRLFADLQILLDTELSFAETLYFAAMIHLVFVKIHPFEDGNGITARLLEKWFMAAKLGPKAWFVQSEKNDYTHHDVYYANIRKLGLEYDALDYSKAMPFLLLLPAAITPQM